MHDPAGARAMRRRRWWRSTWTAAVAAAAVLTAAAAAGTATAGGPGSWSDVTGDTGTDLTQVDTARDAAGALWVAFTRHEGAKTDLLVRPVSPSGALGPQTIVQSGWDAINNPAIVRLPGGGFRLFFSGMRSTLPTDPYEGLTDATSATGTDWTLRSTSPVVYDDKSTGSVAYAADVDATVSPGGQVYQTWSGVASGPVWVHVGDTVSSLLQHDFMTALGGGSGYFSALECDRSTGSVWVAWMVLDDSRQGLYAERVDSATCAAVGSPQRLADASSLDLLSSKVPTTSRPGRDGVFAVAPVGAGGGTVRLWRLGDSVTATDVAGGSQRKEEASVAADGSGRVWVVWSQDGAGRDTVYARRSDSSVSRFGATVSVKTPKGLDALYHLTADASDGRLDVFAHLGGDGSEATYSTQLLPGLSATASPAKVKAGKKARVTVKVADAGAPVAGAAVKLGGRSAKTAATGKATLTVTPRRGVSALVLTVKKAGYASASVRIRVRK